MISIILFFAVFVSAGVSTTEATARPGMVKPVACHFFGYQNAEKLLGQKVTGTDGFEEKAGSSKQWTCTFTAASGEGKLYFGLFKDSSEEAARNVFRGVRSSNQKHKGFEDWPGVGDEALVHSDGKTFQFVMVRKGTRTIRIKLNPLSEATLDDVKAVAVALVGKLE